MTIYAQYFATLADIDADLNLLGSERESVVFRSLRSACDFLREELGHFVPVTASKEVRTRNGASGRLFVPPLLSISSITLPNYGITLNTSDYVPGPDGRMWTNGPYAYLDRGYRPEHLSEWDCQVGGNVIVGQWGMYLLTEAINTQVATLQNDSQTTLAVKDGGQVSPGMLLLLGSEQQLVTATSAATAAITTLAAELDASSEVATLTSGAAVNIGEILRIGVEQFKVLDINSNTAYLSRGWNKTQKVLHAAASAVDVYRTFTVQRNVNGTTAASHAADLDLLRYTVPGDVNILCREIAGRMLKFAQSGFAGKVGDEQSGTTIYQSLIPMADVERVKANYYIPNAR